MKHKDKEMQALIRLALCPGTPGDIEICPYCPHRDNPGTCAKDLKESCRELLNSGLGDALALLERAEEVQDKVAQLAIEALRKEGIPEHYDGFLYLKEAICICVGDPEHLHHLVKEVYLVIGERREASWNKIERSIRSAIDQAWINREDRPKNLQFLTRMVKQVQEELKL